MTILAVDADTQQFQVQLCEALLRELEAQSAQIESFERRGEGYSWETYLVSVRIRKAAGDTRIERYAVKREPSAGLLGSYDVQREVDLLNTVARDIGCPVPSVAAYRTRFDNTRGFYAMVMVDGVVPMPWDVKKVIPDEAIRRNLGLELADIMAKLHGKSVTDLHIDGMHPPLDAGSTGFEETRKWHEIYVESRSLHVPVLDLAFAWLKHRADAVSGRVSLVHNDLRIGNVMVNQGRVAAVLDWETADFTDPGADLAKFNLPTFRGRSTLSGGLIEWTTFLDAYEAATGWKPSERTLNFWTVLEIAKTAVGSLRGVHYFTSGKTNDIRYANMRWQAHHSIKWLVQMFESGVWGQ